jgi:hypothetical protein
LCKSRKSSMNFWKSMRWGSVNLATRPSSSFCRVMARSMNASSLLRMWARTRLSLCTTSISRTLLRLLRRLNAYPTGKLRMLSCWDMLQCLSRINLTRPLKACINSNLKKRMSLSLSQPLWILHVTICKRWTKLRTLWLSIVSTRERVKTKQYTILPFTFMLRETSLRSSSVILKTKKIRKKRELLFTLKSTML